MLRKIAEFLNKHRNLVFWIAVISFLVDTVCLTIAGRSQGVWLAADGALSRSAGFLMTLSSPADLKESGNWYLMAKATGWLVSLSGWLLIPTLVAAMVSSVESQNQSLAEIRYAVRRRGEELGLSGPALVAYVDDVMKVISGLK